MTRKIDDDELNGIIREAPNGKAAGKSQIGYEMFKNCRQKERIQLRNIFNKILEDGKVPAK
jgi:hypothetical protein